MSLFDCLALENIVLNPVNSNGNWWFFDNGNSFYIFNSSLI